MDCLIILLALAVIGLFVGNKIKQNQEAAELARLAERAAELVPELKKLGFLYVTLDLEGFRSGSMDLTLKGILK